MNWKKSALMLAGVFGIILLAAFILWANRKNAPLPFAIDTTENAYYDFVKADSMLIGAPESALDLEEFVRTNQPAFALTRAALKRRFEAPVETYDMNSFSQVVIPTLASLKRLGLALKADGTRAEEAGQHKEAAGIYVELMQFGQKIQKGPIIFSMVGLAVANIGLRALENVEPELRGADRSEIASRVEQLEAEQVPFDEVVLRERHFARRNCSTPFHYLIASRMSRSAIESAEIKHQRQIKARGEFLQRLKGERKD